MESSKCASRHGLQTRVPLLLAVASLLAGCGTPFLRQGANQFNSNTYVGWIPPDKGDAPTLTGQAVESVWTQSVRGRSAEAKFVVQLGDCFAVDYAGGYLHDSFEGRIEKVWAAMNGSVVRSEFSIVLKAEQRIPQGQRNGATDLKEEGTFVFSNTGQLPFRHFTGNSYENFYGPARYRGGEVQLTASIAEQDQDEYNEMVRDSVSFARSAANAANKVDGNSGQDKKKGTDYLAELLKNASSADVSKLTVSPLGYVAVAAEAVRAGAYMLHTINQENDNVMKESVTLVDASDAVGDARIRPLRPLLRYGTYVFARASVDMNRIDQDACISYSSADRTARARFSACPSGSELPSDYKSNWTTVTAVAVNVRPVNGQMCLSSAAKPVQTGGTGVTEGKQ